MEEQQELSREEFVEASTALTDEILAIVEAKLKSILARGVDGAQLAGAMAASACYVIKLVALAADGTDEKNQLALLGVLNHVLDQLRVDVTMILDPRFRDGSGVAN